MDASKEQIRCAMRDARRALGVRQAQRAEEQALCFLRRLPAYVEADAVLAYVATENEVPTADLIADALAGGKRVFLPVDADPPAFRRWLADEKLVAGRRGIPEPRGPLFAPSGSLRTIVLVPMVAWDESGNRLGRGGGFYDRALGALGRAAVRVGLAYEFQRHRNLPVEPHDQRLDYVITEQRIVRCAVGSAAYISKEERDDDGNLDGPVRAGTRRRV